MITRKQRLLCRDHDKNKSASHASRSFTVCTPIEAHKQTNCANLLVFTYLPPISYSYLIEHLPQDLSVCLHSNWCTWQNRKCCYSYSACTRWDFTLHQRSKCSCHRTCYSQGEVILKIMCINRSVRWLYTERDLETRATLWCHCLRDACSMMD